MISVEFKSQCNPRVLAFLVLWPSSILATLEKEIPRSRPEQTNTAPFKKLVRLLGEYNTEFSSWCLQVSAFFHHFFPYALPLITDFHSSFKVLIHCFAVWRTLGHNHYFLGFFPLYTWLFKKQLKCSRFTVCVSFRCSSHWFSFVCVCVCVCV